MPAKLIVESGDERSVHWIEFPVLRLGRSATADVQLVGADIRDHHLTIEFRNGGYWVHNRSSNPISVGRRSAASGASIEFPGGQALAISSDLRLLLEIEGDAAPAPRHMARDDDGAFTEDAFGDGGERGESPDSGEEGAAGSDEDAKPASAMDAKTVFQAAVIGLCLLGCAGLLLAKMFASDSGSRTTAVKSLLELQPLATSEWQQRVFEQLQRAESARLRRSPAAGERFYRLRDELLQHGDDQEFSSETKRFVQARLEALTK